MKLIYGRVVELTMDRKLQLKNIINRDDFITELVGLTEKDMIKSVDLESPEAFHNKIADLVDTRAINPAMIPGQFALN